MSNPGYPQFYPSSQANGGPPLAPGSYPGVGMPPSSLQMPPPPTAFAGHSTPTNQFGYPAFPPPTTHAYAGSAPSSLGPGLPNQIPGHAPVASYAPPAANAPPSSATMPQYGGYAPAPMAQQAPPLSSFGYPASAPPSGADTAAMPAYAGPPPPTGQRTAPFGYPGGTSMPPPPSVAAPQPPTTTSAFGPPVMPGSAPVYREPATTSQPVDRRSNARIDPAHIPRPQYNPEPVTFETRGVCRVPPPATDDFMTIDIGNCNPRCLRSTLYSAPLSNSLRQNCGIPFAMVATPLADSGPGEDSIPIVEFGPEGPIRCSRCRCYMNPFVSWQDNGNKWGCNMCGLVNETPAWYYCSLDGSNQRRDRSIRAELSKGSVDLVATQEYCVRPLQEPIYVFAIDISDVALQSGFTHACLRAVRQAMAHLPGGARARVGIMTFGSHVNLYTVASDTTSSDPVKIYLSEIDDPFCALSTDQWILDVTTGNQALNLLIDSIPLLATYHSSPYACPTAAIAAAVDALQRSGGRVFLMTASHPSIGYGRLRNRDAGPPGAEWLQYAPPDDIAKRTKDPEEKSSMQQYEELAQLALQHQVCVEVFVHSVDHTPREVSALAYLTRCTGGQTHYLVGDLTAPTSDKQSCLIAELTKSVSSIRGSEAVFKIRCSTGLKLERYVSAGVIRATGEVEFAGVHSTTSITCLLANDGTMKDQSECYVQFAVLYTSPNMQRLVRIHTLALGVTASPATVFKDADVDACAVAILHQAADKLLTIGPIETKKWIEALLVNLLLKYREQCSPQSAKSQLILPEPLKLLSLYCLGILKHPMMIDYLDPSAMQRAGEPILADEKAYSINRLLSVSVVEALKILYPRLYPVGGEFERGEGEPEMIGELVRYKLPRPLSSTSELLDSEGMFILDDGRYLYLYIGRNVPAQTLQDWFNISPNARPDSVTFSDHTHAQRMQNIVQELRRDWSVVPPIKCVWPDVRFGMFALRLVEDSIRGSNSYVDFLCGVHATIQEKLK